MGVPAFYRWLTETHPKAITDVIEEQQHSPDTTLPNPNGVEFDNLYLDMNGIIHPCFHPQHVDNTPTSYDEVFVAVFKYIDRVFSIIRPRKLLYLAIDGVAPRAKMNQQRARRFKAAKEAAEEDSGEESGKLTGTEQHDKLDSNVITPGTEFMSLLSSALGYYVRMKMNEDPGWKDIKVIVSDASVPGEGEHKIMSYIRLQRNLSNFDPNTRHCLYGLDADLIMLALASHEIHFSILREDATKQPEFGKSERMRKISDLNRIANMEDYIMKQKFQFFHVWVLREYLMHELRIADRTVKIDLERLVDDFVFMCMFVGNDFLPNMPSLQISEGALDLLMQVYKQEFVQMGGYLTDSCKVNLDRVQHFLRAVSSYENVIFKKRSQVKKNMDVRFRGSSSHSRKEKTKGSGKNASGDVEPVIDQIKLGEEGWKERYYAQKFEAKTNDELERIRKHTVLKYVEGMCWNMHYYYEGVCSWQWFYPYHYAPFASDFHDLDKLPIEFTIGMPFKPLDQLMAVLPAASAHALPRFYRELMTDPSSPILDFYPSDFELDMNGKRFAWQAICKLPFIEESHLLREIEKVEHTLTDEEKRRNSLGLDMLFVHKSHRLAGKIFSFWLKSKDHPKLHEAKVKQKINPAVSDGMNGYMYVSDNPVCPAQIDPPIDSMPMILENKVISVFYKYPDFHPHIPRPPEGVIMPSKSISKKDIFSSPVLWHQKSSIPGRVYLERRTSRCISSRRLAISAHHLVSMLRTQERNGLADRKSIGDVNPVPNQKSTASENEVNGEWKASCKIGEFKEECTIYTGDVGKLVSCINSTTSEKEINGKRKEYEVTAPKRKKNRKASCLRDVEPISNQKLPASENKINGEGKASDKGGLSKEECDERTGNDHVEPVPSMKPIKSEIEVTGERKESDAIVSSRPNQKEPASVEATEEMKVSGLDDVVLVPEQKVPASGYEEKKESDAIVSKKRKRHQNRSKEAFGNCTGLDDVMSGPNHREPASVEVIEEMKVSGFDNVVLVPEQKVPASGHEERKESDAIVSKKRKRHKDRSKEAFGNSTGLDDVMSGPNHRKPAPVEVIEEMKVSGLDDVELVPKQKVPASSHEERKESDAIVSKKKKRHKDRSKEAFGNSTGLDDVMSGPNHREPAPVEVIEEMKVSGLDDVVLVPEQKVPASGHEERKESDAIVSKKRRHKDRSKEAFGNSTGLDDMMSGPNQKEPASVTVIEEMKVSVLDHVVLVPEQKVPASGHEVNEGNELSLEDVAAIPNQKSLTNCISVSDIAFVSNQKPSDSEKEVNREGNESGAFASAKSVAFVPNQMPIALAKEVNGEKVNSGAMASKKRKCRKADQKPSDSLKEVNGEGKESSVNSSRKSGVALVPNPTFNTPNNSISGERKMSLDKSPSLSLPEVLMTGHSCLQNQTSTVSEQEIDKEGKVD